MTLPRRLAALALALCLPPLAGAGAEPAHAPAAPPTSTVVAGVVSAVDLASHRLTLETSQGSAEVGWDRNTLIYQPGGATTAAGLRPGLALRAGLDPARTAYWIQLRPPPEGTPAPGAGAGSAAPAPSPPSPPAGQNSTPGATP
jgi:hypothetical protein